MVDILKVISNDFFILKERADLIENNKINSFCIYINIKFSQFSLKNWVLIAAV